jgi:hypothetical protein
VQGRVVFLVRPGQHRDVGHPNAVVLEVSAGQYLCVAGFTPGKPAYATAEQAEYDQGIWRHEFAIEIDHAKDLIPGSQVPADLHVCGYVFQTAQQMSASDLNVGRDWGTLPPNTIRAIAEGLLVRHARKSLLPPRVVKLLQKYLGR